jgi:hypothetical protein
VTPSLTRGRVCKLLLLLGLASAVPLGYESCWTQDPILLSQFLTPSTWRTWSLCLYLPGTEWPSYTPGHWFPFSRLLRLVRLRWRYFTPPPYGNRSKSRVKVILRPTISRPVCLGVKHSTETRDQLFPFSLIIFRQLRVC